MATIDLKGCSSSLRALFQSYFSAACAPPSQAGEVGVCDLCPQTATQSCDRSNPYAGDGGALRGLIEGVCDVAFVSPCLGALTCLTAAAQLDYSLTCP